MPASGLVLLVEMHFDNIDDMGCPVGRCPVVATETAVLSDEQRSVARCVFRHTALALAANAGRTPGLPTFPEHGFALADPLDLNMWRSALP